MIQVSLQMARVWICCFSVWASHQIVAEEQVPMVDLQEDDVIPSAENAYVVLSGHVEGDRL
jgi:hypothetical protein